MRLLAILMFLLVTLPVMAASSARLLPAEELGADAAGQLAGELAVFESIGEGIAISLAVCADAINCEPALSEAELSQLLDTIDRRIRHLDEVEAGNTALINEYQQTRQQYALYLRELRNLGQDAVRRLESDAEANGGAEAEDQPAAEAEPEPEQTAELPRQPARPKYDNSNYDLEYFEDADELIRSD